MLKLATKSSYLVAAAVVLGAITGAVGIASVVPVKAQTQVAAPAIEQTLTTIIKGWQTGADTSAVLSADMVAVVKQQTGGKGIYKDIQVLGTLGKIDVLSQQTLPKGTLYHLRASHQTGYSDWVVGVAAAGGQVTYVTFNTGANPAPAPAKAAICYFVGAQLC